MECNMVKGFVETVKENILGGAVNEQGVWETALKAEFPTDKDCDVFSYCDLVWECSQRL